MADWQPGDLALCVRGGVIVHPILTAGFPIAGHIYTVGSVGSRVFTQGTHLALWLIDGPVNSCGEIVWPALRFVKVTPGTEIEGVEVERRVPIKAHT